MEKNQSYYGKEFPEYKFSGFLDWLITINDPREIWKVEPTYLISEWVFITIGLLTFIHSQRVGGRFKWLWLACIIHGFFVENVTFWTPEINNFWHSQTTIVLLGRRLPLHILMLYPTFIYTASACVARLRLGKVAQATATGLAVVLIDMPYDIMAVKFVHWTWHDTDPNIYDRHYWVPFTSYYFHATFASSFIFMFHFWRRRICQNHHPENQWVADKRTSREFLCTLLTGFCGMAGGVLQFLPLYHPLHDYFKIHTENCVIALVVIYFLIAWMEDRNPTRGSRSTIKTNGFNELAIGLILHYSLYLGMAIYGNPEDEVAYGIHEKIGPCNKWMEQKTMFTLITGEVNKRRKYLCLDDFDEQYFDFSCVGNQKPQQFSEWYTICGVPFANRAEYVQVIGLVCVTAFIFFRSMLFASGQECNTSSKNNKTKKR